MSESVGTKKKPGFIIDELHRGMWESLPDTQCGQLLKLLIQYQFDGTIPPNLSPELRIAFSFLKPILDKQRADYEATCKARKEAAEKRWREEKGK